MSEFYIAWWNLENLFDVTPWGDRARKVKNVEDLQSRLKGWTQPALEKKLSQLAEVIQEMNSGKGPDVLGVCEVETEAVLRKLVEKVKIGALADRSYDTVYHDCKDERGIDVAFIYDKAIFEPYAKNPNAPENSADRRTWFSYEVIKRSATRDILQANFFLKCNPKQRLIFVGNHWPSRLGGTYETEPYRIMAAETLAYFNQRIQEEYKPQIPILFMGDFNDEPGSRSLTDYALSSRNKDVVLNAREKPKLYNLMWPLMDAGCSSFWFEDQPLFFDQFLVSKGFLGENPTLSVLEDTVEVIHPLKMLENEKPPKGSKSKNPYPQPRRFGLKPRDPLGYSDHFPISVKLEYS